MKNQMMVIYGCLCLSVSGVSGYKVMAGALSNVGKPAQAAVTQSDKSYKMDACSTKDLCFQVPIKYRNHGVPVIDVQLNGIYVCEFLLDTGASKTTIPYNAAIALGLQIDGSFRSSVADGRTVEFDTSRVNHAQIGLLSVGGTPVAISKIPYGLIGQNILEGYDVVIKQEVVEFHTRK